jgi:hypothetical protein
VAREDLDPWRVILHHLFFFHSRDIPHMVDRTGLAVDWALTDKEAYSDNTRLAAYRPRINAAYEALTPENKLRAAYVLVSTFEDIGIEELDEDLRQIGWKVESGRLIPENAEVSELFFPTGSQHAAYVEIRRILQQARRSIDVIDPWADGTIFTLLANVAGASAKVRILTSKLPTDFQLEARKFLAQYPQLLLEVRLTKEFQRNRDALVQQLQGSWRNASPVTL